MESEKEIFTSFERIFAKLAHRAFNVQELEQLRVAISRVVNAVRVIADRKALERCKKLNDAVSIGFTKVTEDVLKIEERLVALEGKELPKSLCEVEEGG